MFERKKSPLKRLAIPVTALILTAAASWYASLPGLHIASAQAHTANLIHTAIYAGPKRHGGIPLETLRNAEDRLDSAPVRNSHGDAIGFVQHVTVGRGGRPETVRVAFGGFFGIGAAVVPLKADALGYDPRHNVILTDMTVRELRVIAARRAKQKS